MIAASSLRTTVPVRFSYVDGIIEVDGKQVPVVYFRQEPNKPWFMVKPIQNLSGAVNMTHTTARVAAKDKGSLKDLVASRGLPLNESAPDYTNYNEGRAIYVNESGLFAILLFSQKPELKLFRRWVTSEVLPEIFRTGSYKGKSDKLPLATQNRVETAVDVFAHPPHDMVQQFWISAIKEKTLTFQAEEAWKRAVFKVNEEAHAKTSKADGEAHAWALKADAEARTQTLKADEEARQAVAEARTQTLKADKETHARTSKADKEAHVRNSKADEEAKIKVIKSRARVDLAKISAEKKRVVTVCKADELEAMERIDAATARLSSMPAVISPPSAVNNALLEASELATAPAHIASEQPPVKRRRQIGDKPEFACYRAVGISDSDVPKDLTEANL
jgi:prophage antirepressor-like protein